MYIPQNQNQMEYRQFQAGNTDYEGAKVKQQHLNVIFQAVAKRIFEIYDKDKNGVIDTSESQPMLIDAYKSFNRQFKPSRGDVDSFTKILDRNGDGRVTYQDIEDLCVKYLCSQIQQSSAQKDKYQ